MYSETCHRKIKDLNVRSAWVVQSAGRSTLDFDSGHELRAVRSSPMLGSLLGMNPA